MQLLTLTLALLLSTPFTAAIPLSPTRISARQEQMPGTCTEYCSVAAGCVCIERPTNCLANYTVQNDDTCTSIVDKFNAFTATELFKWNPEIGRSCFGLRAFVPICINVSGYTYSGPVRGGDIKTPSQIPVPIMPNIVSECQKFEFTDKTGVPTLGSIFAQQNITRSSWNTWNWPANDPDEEWAVWAGYWSCVGV